MGKPVKCFHEIQESNINLAAFIQCFSALMVSKGKLGSAGSLFYKPMLPLREIGHNMVVYGSEHKPLRAFSRRRKQWNWTIVTDQFLLTILMCWCKIGPLPKPRHTALLDREIKKHFKGLTEANSLAHIFKILAGIPCTPMALFQSRFFKIVSTAPCFKAH